MTVLANAKRVKKDNVLIVLVKIVLAAIVIVSIKPFLTQKGLTLYL